MGRQWLAAALLIGGATVFSSCSDDDDDIDDIIDEPTGTLAVNNQFYGEGEMIVVEAISLTDDGWVVIHRDNGNNGPIVPDIISEPVYLDAGVYDDVEVMLADGEEVAPGETLWAMLHLDNGQEQVYEFDGGTIDPPLTDDDGNIIMEPFVNEFTFGTNSITYPMLSVDGSGISGQVTFTEGSRADGAYVTIDLVGTPDGGDHPAHIHDGMALSGGGIAFPLENVDGTTGESTTFVGDITYENLLTYDGYVNVHLGPDEDLATIVSTGNIGANSPGITGEMETYEFMEMNNSGVTGIASIFETDDGNSLVVLDMEGTIDGTMHPAHIHEGDIDPGGGIVISLNDVDGNTGISYTEVSMFDDETAVDYNGLLAYDGYINVHLNPDDLTVVSSTEVGAE